MEYFDFKTVADEAGLNKEQLELIVQRVRRDYPSDDMLFELHVLRACRALRDRVVSFEQIIAPEPSALPTSSRQ